MKFRKKNSISILLTSVFILAQLVFPLAHSKYHKKLVACEHQQTKNSPGDVKDDCGLCDILAHQHLTNDQPVQLSCNAPLAFIKYFSSLSNPVTQNGTTFLSRGPPALS